MRRGRLDKRETNILTGKTLILSLSLAFSYYHFVFYFLTKPGVIDITIFIIPDVITHCMSGSLDVIKLFTYVIMADNLFERMPHTTMASPRPPQLLVPNDST